MTGSGLFAAIALAAAVRADSLDAILERMNHGAKNFKSVSARLHEVTYNHILNESEAQDAGLRLHRGKRGLAGIVQFHPPDEHTIAFEGKAIQIYYPKANQVQLYDVGKNASQLDEFILLAFGAAGNDLTQNYDIKLIGPERIGGAETTHLELTPKSPEAKKIVTRIDLWIPEGKNYAIQEKLTKPDQDYVLNTYSDVNFSPALPDSAFELQLPAGVQRIKVK